MIQFGFKGSVAAAGPRIASKRQDKGGLGAVDIFQAPS
jgi:hypothetical protein